MYILDPIEHETIWGGEKIKRYYPIKSSKVGHLYMVSGHLEFSNTILNCKDRNITLYDLFKEKKVDWNMERYEEFPLTVAIVDASENLSIQVHPDSIVAKELEGASIGKKESWFFLESPNDGWIYGGCCSKSVEEIRKAVDEEKIETITAHKNIESGDIVYIPEGILHAMTAGSLVYEVEYGSNFTYRFFDYNRVDSNGKKRELHLENALKAIKLQNRMIISESHINQWESNGIYEMMRTSIKTYCNNSKTVEIVSILDGKCEIDGRLYGSGISILFEPGEKMNDQQISDCIITRLVSE